MALTTAVHDSLPYIDAEPTAPERAAAQSLIDAELSHSSDTPHPNLPALRESQYSPLVEAEHHRILLDGPGKLKAIDMSRYEALQPPTTSPDSKEKHPETLQKWRAALAQAYTSHSYLTSRISSLALLEEFGKNAWLIGNSQLEDELRAIEAELAEKKTQIDLLAVERRNAQDAVAAEIRGLDEGWKRGVSRALETEVAAEGLRREILEKRRAGAN